MIDKETYLEELTRYFNSIRDDKYKGEAEPASCIGVSCTDCIFNKQFRRECNALSPYNFNALVILDKWSREHQKEKYKISKLEYDILNFYSIYFEFCDFTFDYDRLLMSLIQKGYFKGANKDMKLEDYLDHCEVESK